MKGKITLVVTCLVVAAATGWFAVARWEQANRVATVMSAVAAVAAVGVAVWAALRSVPGQADVRVSRTGDAIARGGSANTGFRGTAGGSARVRVDRTGSASAEGSANTGAELD
ncbi:hypothetical protein [Saccharothrix variisporea]|uniref:hypothetical protein n=1 Tax=Saccharothrix variisporea TaxID=543527 RepID=UPI001B87F8DA|nr:hypothetical protein [Saccharothrix variisporea]